MKSSFFALFAIFASVAIASQIPFAARGVAARDRYDGYEIVEVEKPTAEEIATFNDMGMDVWESVPGTSATIFLSADMLDVLKSSFPNLSLKIKKEDVQAQIDAETSRLMSNAISSKGWFEEFHRYDETKAWFQDLVSKFNGDRISAKFIPSIGKSHEGRDIFAIEFTSTKGIRSKKPQIYFQGQIHAREWISGATLQYVVDQFLNGYGTAAEITDILDSAEFIIVPIVNPDGYEYTWTKERLWRKNRRYNGGFSYGVDLNRNWDVDWDSNNGASRSPFSETYKGPSVFSEPETSAVSKYFAKHPRIVGGIDFHSYSQLILRPPGLTNTFTDFEKQLKNVGAEMAKAIYDTHGKSYRSIRSVELYPTSGSASEWFTREEIAQKFGHHVYGYTLELRPAGMMGGSGFVISPTEIIPNGEEIFAAMKVFCKATIEDPLA